MQRLTFMGSSPSCNLRVDELYGIGAHFAELMLNLMMAVGQFELKAAPRNQKKLKRWSRIWSSTIILHYLTYGNIKHC